MKKYLAIVIALGAFAFGAGVPLASAQAKETTGVQVSASELPACPSLFRCVVK